MAEKKRIKLVVVGDGAVGKTCLLMAYAKKKFPKKYVPTVFDNYVVDLNVNDQIVELLLWDTAGQEEYDQLRPVSYPKTDIFLVCFSMVSKSSYDNVTTKWYPEIKHYCPTALHILVGTKMDLKNDENTLREVEKMGNAVVTPEDGEHLAKKIRAERFMECSAKTGEGLKEVYDAAIIAVMMYKKRPPKRVRCTMM